jgi:hypothetical protein
MNIRLQNPTSSFYIPSEWTEIKGKVKGKIIPVLLVN